MKIRYYVVLLSLVYVVLNYGQSKINHIETITITVDAYKTIMKNLEKAGIRRPKVVLAQIMHETNKLQSKVYVKCNNCTGMRHNDRGFSKGVCENHAWYASVVDCLKDYKQYQDIYLTFYEKRRYFRSVTTDEEYIRFLDWIQYAEDPLYATKIRMWLNIIDQSEILIEKEKNDLN